MGRIRVAAWLIALTASVPSFAGPREDVAAHLDGWVQAFGGESAKAIADNYAADARLWGTNGKAQDVGSPAITKYFENAIAALPTRKVVIGEHSVRLYGLTAVASGAYEFQFTRKDGTAGALPARFSMTFFQERRQVADRGSSLVAPAKMKPSADEPTTSGPANVADEQTPTTRANTCDARWECGEQARAAGVSSHWGRS